MAPFLERPFSPDTVLELKKEVLRFYQKEGFPIVGVFVPQQNFSSGAIFVLIVVGKIGTISAEGAGYFSNEKIREKLRIRPGEQIRSDSIDADLRWINQNPFRTTSILYEPGQKTGETNITFVTQDRMPIRVYSGYENTGDPLTGTPRFLAGLDWGNAFGVDHQFHYLFITETQPKNWYANVASYTIPLPWRNLFKIDGSYTLTKPSVETSFGLKGKGWQVCGNYSIPFAFWSFDCKASIGYEFKRSNNFLTFGVQTVFDNFIDISQFVLGFEGRKNYDLGSISIEGNVYISPGNMTAFNKTSCFRTERAGSKCNYVYADAAIYQTMRLPLGCAWVMNGVLQFSNGKLLPSEEFFLGGYSTVRGYDEFAVISDDGILLKNEIRSPPLSLPTIKRQKHELQFLGFLDWGLAIMDDPQVVKNHASVLASIGPAVRYQFGDFVFARVDYGVQLSHINNQETHSHRKSRLHFGAQVAF